MARFHTNPIDTSMALVVALRLESTHLHSEQITPSQNLKSQHLSLKTFLIGQSASTVALKATSLDPVDFNINAASASDDAAPYSFQETVSWFSV